MTEEEMRTVHLLNRRFEDHLTDYRNHLDDDLIKHERQDAMHEQNMKAINALTASTQGVVDAYKTIGLVQKFFRWLSGFALIAWAVSHYLADKTL